MKHVATCINYIRLICERIDENVTEFVKDEFA